jgi:ABC-type nitrate/sulfonate/bicarbonate transport system substrate-binding protein
MTHHARRSDGRTPPRGVLRGRLAGACLGTLLGVLFVACAPTAARGGTAERASAPAAPPAGGPPAPISVRVAYAAPGAGLTPVWVAQERGTLREYGLDVDLVLLSGTRADQGVITGDTPIAFGATIIPSRLNGADMVAIAGVVSRISYTLFARPGIASPADLRGKTMVATQPGASATSATLITLHHFGLEPDRDVAIQPTQGSPEQFTLMVQGLADASLFSPPTNLKAREAGLTELAKISDLRIPFMQTGIGIMREYGRDHAEEVTRFLRAYIAATVLARRDAASTKAIIGKYTHTDDDAVLDDAYTYYRDVWGRPDFRVPPEAIASILRVLDIPGAATAEATDFIDNHFVDQLEQEGFMRQVGATE